jgi:hypothetical protein
VSAQETQRERPVIATFEYRTKEARGMVRRRLVEARAMRRRYLFRLRLACAEAEGGAGIGSGSGPRILC